MASAAAVLLTGVAIMQAIELRRITRERDRADRVTEFMTNMFKVSGPSEARGNTITAREILDKSSNEIGTGLVGDPELKAQMLQVMGTVYESLGLYRRAEPLVQQATEIRRRVLGAADPSALDSARQLAWIVAEQESRSAEAIEMDRDLVEVERRELGPNHRTTLATESDLSRILGLAGRYDEAATLCRKVVERQRRVLGIDHPETLESERRMALVLVQQGNFAEADKTLQTNLEIRRRVFGSEDPKTLIVMDDLASVLADEGLYDEAEQRYRQTLVAETRLLGLDHPDTLGTMGNLATVLEGQKRYAESERVQRDVLARCRRVLGSDHPLTALALYNIADVLYEQHRYSEAANTLKETVDIQSRVLGLNHKDTVDSVFKLARDLALAKEPEGALLWLREAVHRGINANCIDDLDKGSDCKSLRSDQHFIEIVAQAHKRAPTLKKDN